jgi:hypothetical protein
MEVSLFVAAVATAVACSLPSEPVEQLALSVDLSTTHVQADTGVFLRLEAHNGFQRTVHLRTMGGCVLNYYFIGPDGNRVSSNWGCHAVERLVDVAPGASIVFAFRFHPTPDPHTVKRWAAGQYQIVGELLGENANVVRETEPVTFTLVCHDTGWPAC